MSFFLFLSFSFFFLDCYTAKQAYIYYLIDHLPKSERYTRHSISQERSFVVAPLNSS